MTNNELSLTGKDFIKLLKSEIKDSVNLNNIITNFKEDNKNFWNRTTYKYTFSSLKRYIDFYLNIVDLMDFQDKFELAAKIENKESDTL